ncbi:lipase family protein [Kiloniella litopenaei]|uniref:lipase family protein n=1 Tax=Kiloniella litopenaei TaxID=1549748 RepID=UPI003BA9A926
MVETSDEYGLNKAYCPQKAAFLCRLSEAAYLPKKILFNAVQNASFPTQATHKKFFSFAGTQCFTAKYRGFRVLVFRGTELDLQDIKTDLKFRRRDLCNSCHSGAVHRGFLGAVNPVLNDLKQALKDDDTPLYIAGHSLGGALAVLSAAFDVVPHDLIQVYSFGSPRVGDHKFSITQDKKITHHRVVYDLDVVPMLPFLALGFRHSGTLHFLEENGTKLLNPRLPRLLLALAISFFKGVYKTWSFRKPLNCHRVSAYVDALEKELGGAVG